MPIFKNRHNNVKVYRPNGTKYAHGRHPHLPMAMNMTKKAFLDEFGHEPRQMHEVYEVVGAAGDWVVTYLEVKE